MNKRSKDGWFRRTAFAMPVANPVEMAGIADAKARLADAELKHERLHLSYDCSTSDMQAIQAIAARACELFKDYKIAIVNPVSVAHEVAACHCNGCPLNLVQLLLCSPTDFEHDIGGIFQNLNRRTGGLLNGWWPVNALHAKGWVR